LPAKLVGADPLTDLAVIKVNATNLPSVPWGNSADLHPGQTVLAFGNPYGYRFTVTRGIISALNRPNPDPSDRRKPGEFIQTDAAINPGNSGGALVDARGELIGINTFLISSSGSFSGMGFAIPSQIVQPTVDTLIRDGKVTHGFIGIQISDVTPDNAKFFQMNQAVGAIVSEVGPDTPAAKAGLRTGDVITELDGKPVTDAGQLQMTVGQKRPGDTIHLLVVRDSKPTNIAVTLAALGNGKGTETAGGDHGKARWGLSLADLTPEVRNELQTRKSVQGAMVEEVQPGSPADNAGLQRGDVIMEVNRHAVKSSAEVAEALSSVPAVKMRWCWYGRTGVAPSACCIRRKASAPRVSASAENGTMGVFVRAPRCGTGEDARHSISCVRPGKGKLRPAIGPDSISPGGYESAGGRVNHTDALLVLLARAVNDIPDGHVQLPILEQHVHDRLLRILLQDGFAAVLLPGCECLIRIGFQQVL